MNEGGHIAYEPDKSDIGDDSPWPGFALEWAREEEDGRQNLGRHEEELVKCYAVHRATGLRVGDKERPCWTLITQCVTVCVSGVVLHACPLVCCVTRSRWDAETKKKKTWRVENGVQAPETWHLTSTRLAWKRQRLWLNEFKERIISAHYSNVCLFSILQLTI